MPLNPDTSRFTVITFNLTREQVERLRQVREERQANHRSVSLSDVARDVVQIGLDHVSRAPFSDNVASEDVVPA